MNSTFSQISTPAEGTDHFGKARRHHSSWRTVTVITVVWLAWSVLYAVNLSIVKHDMPLSRTLQLAIPDALIWALLTPPVVWIGRKLPIQNPHLLARLLLHVSIGVAVVTVHELLDAWLNRLLTWIRTDSDSALTVAGFFQNVVPYKWYPNLLLYAVIIGLARLLEHRRQLAETRTQMAMLRADLAEAQLDALRLQLQPHFLFNCLNTISGLIEQRPAEARRMVGRLAELLRLALDTDESEITLGEELHFVRTYLKIEQIRFGDRLRVSESVPEACLAERVPSFILQPLVENSVRHGLGTRSRGGCIEIRAARDDRFLVIEIRDDGVGIDPGSCGQGTGWSSVRNRIRQRYGEQHDLQVESSGPQGTTIRIALPRRTPTNKE